MTDSYKKVKLILWIILFANIAVSGVKIIIGVVCGSISILADGFHSISDSASNIIGLIGVRMASKPVDVKHPYGHGKFEILTSLFIGVMLLLISVEITINAITSLCNPSELIFDLSNILMILFTLLINIVVSAAEFCAGKRLNSTVLITDSIHTRSDCVISAAVLIGMTLIKLGLPVQIDPILSFLVAGAVAISAWRIIKSCSDILVDSAVVDSEEVERILMDVPGVYNVHKVRSRGVMHQAFIDLHVIVSPEEDVLSTHRLSHELENVLKIHFGQETQVCIHIEPDDGRNHSCC